MPAQWSPLDPPLPHFPNSHWDSLWGSSACLAVSRIALKSLRPLLLITPDIRSALIWQKALAFFAHEEKYPISLFSDWETLPYDHFSPHEDIISDRLLTLYRLPTLQQGIVITSLPTLMHRLLPRSYLEANTLILAEGDPLNLTIMSQRLAQAGYRSVQQVMTHGEWAVRGAILDIYPMGSRLPYRIELWDDTVHTLRHFDPDTQRSTQKVSSIRLLPAREYPLTEAAIIQFRQAWREKFTGNPHTAPLYQQISRGEAAQGVEYYLPLFYPSLHTFFHYLPHHTQVILPDCLEKLAQSFYAEVQHRFSERQYDILRPLCPPNEVFLSVDQLFHELNALHQIHLHTISSKKTAIHFSTEPLPNLLVSHKATQALQHFVTDFLKTKDARILFCANSLGRRESLLNLLKTISLSPTVFPHWSAFLESKDPVGITIAPLDEGWLLHSPPLALITESQLFGELPTLQHRVTHRKTDIHAMIRDLTELSIGAPVVHIRHGVGRYQGLQTIITDQHEAEYLTLQYAGDDKIYVPVSSLHLIHRYTGADAEHAPLQKLGSTQWDTIKKKTSQRIRDVAAELLAIYSQRAATPGYAFSPPDDHYHAFRRAFPFEETPDQTEAIENVIHDMIAPRSMDRVICGDVGFGKTEIAMQAAFLAVQNHKQVAVLVPTTLLAEQHWHNFQDRFVDWPVKIAAISRLRTLEERKQILRELSEGKIDILIGTHKLLHNDISFKDLGLLIIDEEHRFGVQQKERIKALRAHVDILMLTATPIPRTLNMALAGTRDLSIIATPPLRRLSIKTFVHEYTISLIREAILREILRGGQVYFLHNDVVSMPATLQKWEKIIPEARIQIAHGQMRERALERVMSDFYHQKFNVLLCTTIIESGIDIPTANTIIIDQAHHFGLAELHQLRGRVGRSHHQAYAYLFTPPQAVLTEEAKKRLDALTTLDTLGVGFQLATHDLEIRGAGELLGTEQSGHMHAVGFSLYLEWLNEAVEALKTGQTLSFEKSLSSGVDIDLGISALLPSDYVPDVHTRLLLYKKLAHCKDKKALEDFRAELIDRFGLIPKPAQYLLDYTEIQQIAAPLGIQKIEIGAHYGYFHFNESPTIQLSHLLRCISEQPDLYRLQQNNRLRFAIDTTDAEVRLSKVQQLLVLLA